MHPINYDALMFGVGALPTQDTLNAEIHQLHHDAQQTLYHLAFGVLAAIATDTQMNPLNFQAHQSAKRMIRASVG